MVNLKPCAIHQLTVYINMNKTSTSVISDCLHDKGEQCDTSVECALSLFYTSYKICAKRNTYQNLEPLKKTSINKLLNRSETDLICK